MDKDLLNKIRSNPIVYSYLREDSREYIYLLKDKKYFKKIENKAKEKYNLTFKDKIEKLSKRLEVIKEIMDVLN